MTKTGECSSQRSHSPRRLPTVRALYENELNKAMCSLCAKQKVWVVCGDDVQFTAYDQADGSRHLYLLAVDWYRDPSALRSCAVRIDGHEYPVQMPFGVMIKCVSDGRCAAWPHDENGEVLCVNDSCARVQGTGTVRFTLAKGGAAKEVEIDFSSSSVQEIRF